MNVRSARARKSFVLLVTVLVALVTSVSACGGDEADQPAAGGGDAAEGGEYRIGWAEAKTGYLSFVDIPVENGMKVAIEAINSEGGIAGKFKIVLDNRDMKVDPALGATVVQELIEAGADFIVTTCDADVSLPGATIAAQNKLPVVSSCGADSKFPEQVPTYGFLNVPGTLSQGAMLAEYAWEQGWTTTYTHFSRDEGYTQTLTEAFEDRFKELGGTILGRSEYRIGDTDFRATATKMVNSKPDVIMTNTFPPDSIALLNDLERLGSDAPLLLVDGNDTPVIWEAGQQLEHAIMTTYGGFRGEGSRIDAFEQDYESLHGGPPESLQTALGADLIYAIAAAVEQADSTDGEKVAEAFANLEDVPGVTGPITYKDRGGLPLKLYAIVDFDVANKEFVVLDNRFPEKIPPPRQ